MKEMVVMTMSIIAEMGSSRKPRLTTRVLVNASHSTLKTV